MQLMKIGDDYFNPDNITCITYEDTHTQPRPITIRLAGEISLQYWPGTPGYKSLEAFIETHAIDPRA
jgi:hypothetical protein